MQPIDPHILFDDEEEDDREVGYTLESIETDDPVLRFALHAMIADVLSLPFDGRPEVTAAYVARGIVGKAVNATTVPFLTIESIFGPHDFDDLLDRIMDLTISRERYERIHVMHELRNSFMPFDLWTKTQLDDAAMVVNPDFLGNIDQDFVEDLFDDLVEQVFGKKELALAAVRAARCEILARRQLHESLVAMPDEFFEGAGAVRRRKLELPRHAKTALDQAVDTLEAISRGKDALRKLMSACSGSDAPFATENQDDEPDEVSKQQAEREPAVERDEASIEGWIPWGLGQDWKECSVLTDNPELLFAVHAMETFLHRLHKTKLRMPVVDDCIYSEKDGIIGDLSSSIEDEDDENEEACARGSPGFPFRRSRPSVRRRTGGLWPTRSRICDTWRDRPWERLAERGGSSRESVPRAGILGGSPTSPGQSGLSSLRHFCRTVAKTELVFSSTESFGRCSTATVTGATGQQPQPSWSYAGMRTCSRDRMR